MADEQPVDVLVEPFQGPAQLLGQLTWLAGVPGHAPGQLVKQAADYLDIVVQLVGRHARGVPSGTFHRPHTADCTVMEPPGYRFVPPMALRAHAPTASHARGRPGPTVGPPPLARADTHAAVEDLPRLLATRSGVREFPCP